MQESDFGVHAARTVIAEQWVPRPDHYPFKASSLASAQWREGAQGYGQRGVVACGVGSEDRWR